MKFKKDKMLVLLLALLTCAFFVSPILSRLIGARNSAIIDQGIARIEALEAEIELYRQLRSKNRSYDFDASCDLNPSSNSCDLDFDPGEAEFVFTIHRSGDPTEMVLDYSIYAVGLTQTVVEGVVLQKSPNDPEVQIMR